MKKLTLAILLVPAIVLADSNSKQNLEIDFKFAYSVLSGSVKSQFTDSTPIALLGSDSFSYSTSDMKNSFNIGILVQTNIYGFYIEGFNTQYKIDTKNISGFNFDYKYNIGRGSIGLGKKIGTDDNNIRLSGGIRIVALGITKHFGTTGLGFVIDDRTQALMPELRLTFKATPTQKIYIKGLASTGLSNKYKSYTTDLEIGYKFDRVFGLGIGTQYEYVKIDTSKNKADIKALMPYLALNISW